MKKQNLILLPLLLAMQMTFAGSYTDYAEIVSEEEVYQTHTIREPYQDCYIQEFYQRQSDDSATPEIMGGILGGLVGRQFGGKSKNSKNVATVAGALLGASLVHDDELAKSKTGRIVTREVCETKYRNESESRLSNYLVKFIYDGRIFTYITKSKPSGKSIKVRVRVSPE
jgi:uncharacterized protein YcfJ